MVKCDRDSEITVVTGLEFRDRFCKVNHRIMTGVTLIFIFTANTLNLDVLLTLDYLSNNHALKPVIYNTRFLATAIIPDFDHCLTGVNKCQSTYLGHVLNLWSW